VKQILFCIVFLMTVFGSLSCSNSDYVSSSEYPTEFSQDKLSGMIRVKATGKNISLGTNEVSARANERPLMQVNFDYDFSIGKHEVTCGEFNEWMPSSTGLKLACENSNLPAADLTYYDAVLFANARSKAEHLDTAYTYVKATFDAEKHCTNLEGFAYHPEIAGYRLPTEAEWVYVASLDWNLKKGWLAENSDYQSHEVCSMKVSENSPCDMTGNVMEWANDWLGYFRDTTVLNYVGAPDANAVGQRVVKGGSFRNAKNSVTPYSRGDVYTVTSATRANYVGFRLAYGPISNATWLNSDGKAVVSRIVSLVNSSTIRSLTGTYRTKLAFRNDVSGNLAYVDFSSGMNSVVEISDTLDVYHPDISPDGQKVAFSTGFEGVAGQSALYVRDLNGKGANLVKLDVESAAIPRWRVLANGDTVIVYVTDAGNNKDDASFKSASTWQVKFSDNKFGKPEKLFDGAFHGGISEDGSLAVTGARLLRARISNRDTVWYNGEQACNASLSKDGSMRSLFLDFGGKTGRNFVGVNYGTHERLLVADAQGNLIQSVAAPAGYSFDHSEWVSGGNNLVVATLANADGAHKKIVAVNLGDSSVTELTEGDELWHPCLWQRENASSGEDEFLNLDSAGAYLSENHEIEQARFRIKLELFWKSLDSIKVFFAGSSRMEMGVYPDLYPEWGMFNFGVTGIDPKRDFYFVKNYALNHLRNLKAIAVSVDLDGWRGSENHLALVLSSGVGYAYDANHDFWKDGLPAGFIEAVENGFPAEEEEVVSFSSRGGLQPLSNGWTFNGIEVLADSVYGEVEMANLNKHLDELKEIVKIASERNVYVIGILFPQAPQYKNTGAYGLYGLQRSVAKGIIAQLKTFAEENPYFILMDENKMGDHDYTDDMAQNRDHLSYVGAQQMTARVESLLRTLKW
jgi:uncharacterized protein (TIGR02171 family)